MAERRTINMTILLSDREFYTDSGISPRTDAAASPRVREILRRYLGLARGRDLHVRCRRIKLWRSQGNFNDLQHFMVRYKPRRMWRDRVSLLTDLK